MTNRLDSVPTSIGHAGASRQILGKGTMLLNVIHYGILDSNAVPKPARETRLYAFGVSTSPSPPWPANRPSHPAPLEHLPRLRPRLPRLIVRPPTGFRRPRYERGVRSVFDRREVLGAYRYRIRRIKKYQKRLMICNAKMDMKIKGWILSAHIDIQFSIW
jgi:hypothetical protein